VLDARTSGESGGSFMCAVSNYAQLSGDREMGGKDLPRWIGQVGLIEARGGGHAFAQLYAALALESFGADLNLNRLWQSLSSQEKQSWRSLLDPGRFYDRKTRTVIHLPKNYFGVAARVTAIDYRLGLITDKTLVDDVLDRAVEPFTRGALFADDDAPTGRFDHYSNEYVFRRGTSLGLLGILLASAAHQPRAYPVSRGSAPPSRKFVIGSITMPFTRPSSSFTLVIS
jgi:hypothetical protein